jgi:Protein of unknown function (DUF1549)/Protein of unknown function (DUF1553)/Planctomycete cytochrome C
MRLNRLLPICTVILFAPSLHAAGPASKTDFNRDIRPILSNVCFDCHGPDQKQRKGDLRLDLKEDLYKKRDGYSLVVPGKPADSELYARLTDPDEKQRMPPPEALRKIDAPQIELIRRWIEEGAPWQGHWAYELPIRPIPPDVKDERSFLRNDVDRFILQSLRAQGLGPAPEADRATLIRRLSFDLVGLPPTAREVAEFVSDARGDAYEKLVDRLLAAPQFGERMAMFWLDLVRYADTNGYHGDNHEDRDMYRDWVISAFNGNMPFDRFTTEQLAGDLIPDATIETRIASGYNRLLMTTREGGAQAKEYLAKYSADRVRNFSAVWLAGTMGCCECHDHKYDPFTTRDFYSLAAFFADIRETAVGEQPGTKIPTPKEAAALADFDARLAPLRKIMETQTAELDSAQAAWEKSRSDNRIEWRVVRPVESKSQGGATLKTLDDGSIFATDENPDRDTYELTFRVPMKKVTALRLEVLPDESLSKKGPGRSENGNFVLHEVQMTINGQPVEFSNVTATYSQPKYEIKGAVDGKPETGWGILDQTGRSHQAVFEWKADVNGDEEAVVTIAMVQGFGFQHTIGRFQWAATSAPRPVIAEGSDLPQNIAEVFAVEPEKRTEEQRQRLSAYFRSMAPQLEVPRRQLAELQKERDTLFAAVRTTLVSMSGPPRTMRVLPRGSWLDESGEIVKPAVPGFLTTAASAAETGDRTRLDLARWVVSPENPLTARVFVNRLWKIAFGQGLVRTVEDFGAQGTPPTHPELLDWLALEFMGRIQDSGFGTDGTGTEGTGTEGTGTEGTGERRAGAEGEGKRSAALAASPAWDVRRILKLIVMSGTYRQSSLADETLRQRDPFNHWLARQGRYRLEAEVVRDNALAVSGLLVHKLGGPSAKPYQPGGYWAYLNFPVREWEADKGDGLYRRGLYTYWCRTFLQPSLKAFDAPTREECTADRPRSNTPIQALVLLNDPSYVEAARVFAERIMRDGGANVEARVRFACLEALSREPRREEASLLATLFARHFEQYRQDANAASALLHVGERPVPADLDPAELAAWTSVARAIFNLHEMVTRN